MSTMQQLDLFDFDFNTIIVTPPKKEINHSFFTPPKTFQDYSITADDVLEINGSKSKFEANYNAIKLLKELELTNILPSNEQAKTLIKYSGWGGLANAFNINNDSFQKEYNSLKNLLTTAEYDSAKASVLSSHYTPKSLIQLMWKIALHCNFTGGKIGEFGAGIGHFIGLMPTEVATNSSFNAIEIDDISGRIIKKLYPNTNVIIKSLQHVQLENNSFDLIIGNVPFSQIGVYDKNYPNWNLHNYFIVRALDSLKNGGLAILLTSSSTLDSKANLARLTFAKKAGLIATFRLPNDTFKNANTEVVSDILIFQKGANCNSFIDLTEVDTFDNTGTMFINEYFAHNPTHIVGNLSNTGRMYGRVDTPTVTPKFSDYINIIQSKLSNVSIQKIEHISIEKSTSNNATITPNISYKEHALFIQSNKIYKYENGQGFLIEFSVKELNKIKSFIGLKECLIELIAMQQDEFTADESIEEQRKILNKLYDIHYAQFGALNNQIIHKNIVDDPQYLLVAALENASKTTVTLNGIKTNKITYTKGDILNRRTQYPWTAPKEAKTFVEAGLISNAYKNCIDLKYVAYLMNSSIDEAKTGLLASNEFFHNPQNGNFELKSQYLSGNVVRKLESAITAASMDSTYANNVKFLKQVQPTPLKIEDIDFKLGSAWIEPNIINMWFKDDLDAQFTTCKYYKISDKWRIEPSYSDIYKHTNYSIGDYNIFTLIETTLNLKDPIVNDKVYNFDKAQYEYKINQEKTLTARQFVNQLKQKFYDFVVKNIEATKQIEDKYNKIYNNHVNRQYALPVFDVYPGASSIINGKEFILREHQKRAVTRCIEGNTLLAHCVGAGKTAVMVTAAMELKRLKLAMKSLIVVQNSTLQQFAEFTPRLYPNANILIANKKDLVKDKRKRFMAKIATGDWDIVIMAHSTFDMIENSVELTKEYYQTQIDELELVIGEAKNDYNNIKDLERSKASLKQLLDKLNDKNNKEDMIYFDQLGFDSIFVDECHNYKKNFFPTKMERIKGLDKGSSKKAFSLNIKLNTIKKKTNGRNIYMATGTPVTNTIAELWTMIRYVSKETLEEFAIESFDRFASTFTDTETALEIDAASRFKMVKRFCKYSNVIEMSKMFNTVADIIVTEDLKGVERPPLKSGAIQQINIPRSETISTFMNYLQDTYEWFEHLSDKRKYSHVPLLIFGMSRKITIDPRLIHINFSDDPNSKLNVCARKIIEKYHEYNAIKGTQIVFCDMYRNVINGLEVFNAYKELKRKLIANGINEAEIAIINDYNSDKQKSDLFDAVNKGDVRVVIGSTQKLGTGVNIQERLAVAHHIDAPYRPSDMEQRNGRIIRQGNILSEVEIIQYGISQTLDAGMYAILERKQKFINSAMKGGISRSLEEIHDTALDYANFSATISGNEDLKRKIFVETRLKELNALERQNIAIERGNNERINFLKCNIPLFEKSLQDIKNFVDNNKNFVCKHIFIEDVKQSNTIKEITHSLQKQLEKLMMRVLELSRYANQTQTEQYFTTLKIDGINFTLKLCWESLFNGQNPFYLQVMLNDETINNCKHYSFATKINLKTCQTLFEKIEKLIKDKQAEYENATEYLNNQKIELNSLLNNKNTDNYSIEKLSLQTELYSIIERLDKSGEQRAQYLLPHQPRLNNYYKELRIEFNIVKELELDECDNDSEDYAETA